MTAVAQETSRALDLLDRVETLEDVAKSLPKRDTRRSTLLDLVEKDLAAAPPLRPRIAAEVLMLSEKTIRAWIEEGVLTRADQPSPRILLDMKRVHQVLHLVTDLRAAGKSAGLLDEVYHRLIDATWLERQDLAESLEQMARGQGTTRVAKPSARSPGDRMPPCPTPSSPPQSPTARSPRSGGPGARRTSSSSKRSPATAAQR